MLILTRRVGESLKVIQPDGTVVTATVLGVKGLLLLSGLSSGWAEHDTIAGAGGCRPSPLPLQQNV